MNILWYRLMEPMIATARRAVWLAWLMMAVGVIVLLNAADESSKGVIRESKRGGEVEIIERAKQPEAFDGLFKFHVLCGIGWLIGGAAIRAVTRGQDEHDLLASGREFNSLDGD